ncbi:Fic family protein [Ruminococcus sp.]|uniref:Fic/DOC family protein n=1 Tax=Ruminococcus sp. TaxID=41978 RepID=UPI0025CBC522|nr:Fic family protein [Ruminococcus sp.]MBQ8965033.1 Fic family protein [Ruminococcus sp.]
MSYSVESGSSGCYEGTLVLMNKLDIRDEEELAELESILTTTRITMLLSEPYKGSFSAEHYCELHRVIMGDLYDWAGQVRTVPLSKKGTRFHAPEGLERDLGLLFGYLNDENCFLDLKGEDYAAAIAEFYSDLNLLHPFREGNGRTQRVLITQLIERSGRSIDFSRCDKEGLMIATIFAAQGVADQLREFFAEAIKE